MRLSLHLINYRLNCIFGPLFLNFVSVWSFIFFFSSLVIYLSYLCEFGPLSFYLFTFFLTKKKEKCKCGGFYLFTLVIYLSYLFQFSHSKQNHRKMKNTMNVFKNTMNEEHYEGFFNFLFLDYSYIRDQTE